MANVELTNSEYQTLLDWQAELRTTKKELDLLNIEVDNKNKAIEAERIKRKKAEETIVEMTWTLENKAKEIETIKTEYADFEAIKWNADKWISFEENKKVEINNNLEIIKKELWDELLNKHSKFLDNMPDDLKLEYLQDIKLSNIKPWFEVKTNDNWENKQEPNINDRLALLQNKNKETGLSPMEKIEFITLNSQQESKK